MGWNREIAAGKIHPHPMNPRLDYGPIEDLTASIEAEGLLHALVVRPHPDKKGDFQVICGHRRLRAARAAGFETVSCTIKKVDDQAALTMMLAENSQSHPVGPVAESRTLARMVEMGADVDDLKARLGKSVEWVRLRLAIVGLEERAVTMLAEGRMKIRAAAAIGVLDPVAQRRVVDALELRGDATVPLRVVRSIIGQHQLSHAPWDLSDTTLGGRGACDTCPMRTTVQVGLWASSAASPKCTDGACWETKRNAHIARLEEGAQVIDTRRVDDDGQPEHVDGDIVYLDAFATEIGSEKAWKDEIDAGVEVCYVVNDETIRPFAHAADVKAALQRQGRDALAESVGTVKRPKPKPSLALANADDVELAHLRLMEVARCDPSKFSTLTSQAIIAQTKFATLSRVAKRRQCEVEDLYEVDDGAMLAQLLLEIAVNSDVRDARRVQLPRNSFFAQALRMAGVRTPANMLRQDSPLAVVEASEPTDDDTGPDWQTVAKVAAERALATSGTSAVLVGVQPHAPDDLIIANTVALSSKTRSGAVLANLIETKRPGPWLIVSARRAGAAKKVEHAAAKRLAEAARLLDFPLSKVVLVAGKEPTILGGEGQ